MWDGPGALREQDDFKSHQKQVGSQPLHPVLLQAWLKPIQKQLRLVAALESGCTVSFIEPFFYYSGTLFDYSLESCCADFAIFFPPFPFPAAQISVFPKDVSVLTIPSTSQTLKEVIFLIIYLLSFLNPQYCGHSLFYNLPRFFRFLFFFLSFFFFLCRPAPAAYGCSQASGQITATVASLHHSHGNARSIAASATYTTAHDNAGSLIH